jgi:hypothetical protein
MSTGYWFRGNKGRSDKGVKLTTPIRPVPRFKFLTDWARGYFTFTFQNLLMRWADCFTNLGDLRFSRRSKCKLWYSGCCHRTALYARFCRNVMSPPSGQKCEWGSHSGGYDPAVWDETPCSMVHVYRSFRGKYYLYLFGLGHATA